MNLFLVLVTGLIIQFGFGKRVFGLNKFSKEERKLVCTNAAEELLGLEEESGCFKKKKEQPEESKPNIAMTAFSNVDASAEESSAPVAEKATAPSP